MEITDHATRLLQRALNALGRDTGLARLKVDGRAGRKTLASFIRFLAARGSKGEAMLVRAMRALR